MLLGNSILLPFIRQNKSAAQAMAYTHYQRVIADGGTIDSEPDLVQAIENLFTTYATEDLSTFLAACIDPAIFGYKYRTDATGTWCVKAYSLMGASSDVVQATASAQPLLLRYSGEKYAFCPGASNFIASSYTTNTSGDIDIDVCLTRTSGIGTMVGKGSTAVGLSGFAFGISVTNILEFVSYVGGVATVASSGISVTPYVGTKIWFRVFRNSATGDHFFYDSDDGINWNLLATINSVYVLGDNSSAGFWIDAIGNSSATIIAKYYSATVYQGERTSGTKLVDFNAEDYDISVNQTALMSSTTGETWSVVRSSLTTAAKAQIVFRTTIQEDAVNDQLSPTGGAFVLAQPNTTYAVFDEMTWVAGRVLIGGGTAIPYTQTNATPNMSSNAGAALDYDQETLNRLKHYMTQLNGASSLNGTNGVYLTGNAGAAAYSRLDIGANNGANFSNMIFNTLIVAKQADDLATRNLMNTLVRSWSNNPA